MVGKGKGEGTLGGRVGRKEGESRKDRERVEEKTGLREARKEERR